MVQSYLPDGANVPSHVGKLANAIELVAFSPPESTTQTANQSASAQLTAESPYT